MSTARRSSFVVYMIPSSWIRLALIRNDNCHNCRALDARLLAAGCADIRLDW